MPKKVKNPKFPIDAHIRTCQECGHEQSTKDPANYKDDSWWDLTCRKCGAQALDYGSANYEETEEL